MRRLDDAEVEIFQLSPSFRREIKHAAEVVPEVRKEVVV